MVTTSYTVGTAAELNAAIQNIDLGGTNVATNTAYSITFSASFTITQELYAINLASGSSLTINGNSNTLDGNNVNRGFFAYAGTVTINGLTITNTVAIGGAGGRSGGGGGGGGAGLGGGLFVASAANVTLQDVSFQNNSAIGGKGGDNGAFNGSGGGGGGLGGAGGQGSSPGGGGIGQQTARGGNDSVSGADGTVLGAASGEKGNNDFIHGGANGGGGGANGGGGIGAGSGNGGFGGGGSILHNGGFGGGGGTEGVGGFGGGGGGYRAGIQGAGTGMPGFGGGSGSSIPDPAPPPAPAAPHPTDGGGGGGLGAGGAIFVQEGGRLTIGAGTISGGSVTGGGRGAGGSPANGDGKGSAYGSGIFLQGSQTGGPSLSPAFGETLTISDVVADEINSRGSSGDRSAALSISGAGTVILAGDNRYSGGTALNSGVLILGTENSAGIGAITFGTGAQTLRLNYTLPSAAKVFIPALTTFGTGDALEFRDLNANGATATYSGGTLSVASGGKTQVFTLVDPQSTTFVTAPDYATTPGTVVLNALPTVSLSSTPVSANEGNTGSTPFNFTVTRAGSTAVATSFSYSVAGSGANQATANDFVGGALPSGTITFAEGAATATIAINVAGDTVVEPDETFTVTLASPMNGTLTGNISAIGTIITDEAPPPVDTGPSTSPSSGPDQLTGTSGDDTIAGLAGNDTISGGDGNDLLYGNQDQDIVDAGSGNNTVYGGMGNDSVSAGAGNDLLFGNEGADTINAGDGNNTIVGGQDSTDGADLINSGSGNDLIFGNGGADVIRAGGGNDIVVGGFGADILLGNMGNDFIYGNQDNDVIFGGMGDDTLIGGMGDDTLYGNEGNDVLYGNEGADRLIFGTGSGMDIVNGFSSSEGDRLDLQGQTYTTTQDANGNAVLTLSGGGMVTLAGIAANQVSAGFFA